MTLSRALRRAAQLGHDRGITYYAAEEGDAPLRQSYAALLTDATRLLGWLQAQGLKPGDKLLSQVASSRRLIEIFWACVLGGMVPVLLPKVVVWNRESEPKRRLAEVWKALAGPPVLIDDGFAPQRADMPELASTFITLPPAHDLAAAGAATLHEAQPDDLAYLQFSSGSTGAPKGVRLTHANLIGNIEDIIGASGMCESDVMLGWMPYFHDMGLVGFHLVPLCLGIPQIKLDVTSFVNHPLGWLQKVHEHRATLIASPNFGLQHVLARVTAAELRDLDLSCVRLLYNGAEPIAATTLRRFVALASVARFSEQAMLPVYGMAEAGLAVAFSPLGVPARVHRLDRGALAARQIAVDAAVDADAIEYVDVGRPLPSIGLRIADDRGALLGDARIGEIQIRGRNVTSGYAGNAEANRDLFTRDGWLRTGDLGFMRGGRLTVTGRIKDVIFINGQNVMAQDIEHAAHEHVGLKAGSVAACGVTGAGGEERVIIFVATRQKADLWAALHDIKIKLQEYFAFQIDYVLPTARIPKTSSGKAQRYKLAQAFQAGEFQEQVAAFDAFAARQPAGKRAVAPAPGMQATIHAIWSQVLKLPPDRVGVEDSFMSLGGTSIKAIEVLMQLEQALGRQLGYDVLLQCKTIREMAEFLGSRGAAADLAPAPTSRTSATREPAVPGTRRVAVIGMAGRFPGARSLEEFWANLVAGTDSVLPVSPARWRSHGRRYYMAALEGAEEFAAEFFDIDDQEALDMDPQQRLMLEVVYAALEDAGYAGARMASDRRIGVYQGVSYNSYFEHIVRGARHANVRAALTATTMSGNLLNMVAARVSHVLNLKGPALTFDTACSSALVALHYACNDLELGHCDLALVGGVNLLFTPTVHELFEQAGALAPDGVSRTFDAEASGMVPGEGLGVIALKPLERAIADGDRIDAIIEAVAVNNDGTSLGIMAPNPDGQHAVLSAAYAMAGVDPASVSYIEAHGTGTPIGDPIEVRTLTRVFAAATERKQYCAIGSVKTNVGHLLSAAGIAGLIKVVLAMRHETLPPSLHLRRPHQHIRFENTPFYSLSEARSWPRHQRSRLAGVSSFGFGGTNAHVVLRDGPAPAPRPARTGPQLLCLSARTDEEREAAARELALHLRRHPQLDLRDVCYTRNAGRQQFEHRRFVVANDLEDLAESLEAPPDLGCSGHVAPRTGPTVAFLMSGRYGGDTGMPSSLYREHSVFRQAIDRCVAIVDAGRSDGTLRGAFMQRHDADAQRPEQAESAEPLLFMLQYALAELWQSWGVRPAALLGHGPGEYAAACVAGILGLEDALRLVVTHAQCMARSDAGAMEPYASALRAVNFHAPRIPFISSVESNQVGTALLQPGDWLNQPRRPMSLRDGLLALRGLGVTRCIEIGPGMHFATLAHEVFADAQAAVNVARSLPVSAAPGAEEEMLLHNLGELWLEGMPVAWEGLARDSAPRIVALPTYPFRRKAYWLATVAEPEAPDVRFATAKVADASQPLLAATPADDYERDDGLPLEERIARLIVHELEQTGITVGGRDDPFADYGADSLVAVQVANALQTKIGVALSQVMLFEYDTIDKLAAHLAAEHAAAFERAFAGTPSEAAQSLPAIPPARPMLVGGEPAARRPPGPSDGNSDLPKQ